MRNAKAIARFLSFVFVLFQLQNKFLLGNIEVRPDHDYTTTIPDSRFF